MKRWWTAMALVVSLASQASGQPASQTMHLRIVDARSDLPVEGARLACNDLPLATTDDRGMAEGLVCAGRLTVSAHGYVVITFDGSPPRGEDIRLEPLEGDMTPAEEEGVAAQLHRETVHVAGQAAPAVDAGVPAQFVVTAADLEPLRGALLDDALRTLQALPGVSTTDELRADLSVRGSPFRQVGIVIDDVKSQLLMHTVRGVEQTGSVALLNGDMVASGSLAAGSYPQRHGNSLGAELIVRTRDGRGDRVHGRIMTSAIATTASLDGPLASDRVTWVVAARRSYASWIVRRIDPGISGTFDFQDAHAKLRARLGRHQHLSLTWLGGTSTYDERGRRTSDFAIDVGRNRTQLLSAQWQATPVPSLLVSQRASLVSSRFRNTSPTGHLLDEGHDRELLSRSSAMWTRQRVTVDASATAEAFRLDGDAVRFGGHVSGETQSFSGRTHRRGGHLHVQTELLPSLRLSGGMRVDDVAGVGTAAAPWMQMALAIRPRLLLQVAQGWHRQAPDLLQRAGPNAGVGLVMERARHDDIGLTWRAGSWSASITAYQRREEDVLDTPERDARLSAPGILRPGDPLAPWVNALDGRAHGIELLARVARSRWSGWASYAHSRVRQTSPSHASRFASAFEQAHVFSAVGAVRLGERWDASTTVRLASNWPFDGYYEGRGGRVFLSDRRNALRLPTYARVDVRVRRVLPVGTRRLVLFGEAINLLNRRNIRQVEGTYNGRSLEVFRLSERQLPILPSIGLAFEF